MVARNSTKACVPQKGESTCKMASKDTGRHTHNILVDFFSGDLLLRLLLPLCLCVAYLRVGISNRDWDWDWEWVWDLSDR